MARPYPQKENARQRLETRAELSIAVLYDLSLYQPQKSHSYNERLFSRLVLATRPHLRDYEAEFKKEFSDRLVHLSETGLIKRTGFSTSGVTYSLTERGEDMVKNVTPKEVAGYVDNYVQFHIDIFEQKGVT